jgi:hypothetical protein
MSEYTPAYAVEGSRVRKQTPEQLAAMQNRNMAINNAQKIEQQVRNQPGGSEIGKQDLIKQAWDTVPQGQRGVSSNKSLNAELTERSERFWRQEEIREKMATGDYVAKEKPTGQTTGQPVSQAPVGRTQEVAPTQPQVSLEQPIVPVSSTGQAPQLAMPSMSFDYSMDSIMNMSPEQLEQAKAEAWRQGGQMQLDQLNNVLKQQDQTLANRQQQEQLKVEEERARMMGQHDEDVSALREDIRQDTDQAVAQVQKQGQRGVEAVQTQMAFQGFGRSSKAADLVGQVQEQTANQVASIERESARYVRNYQAQSLDRVNGRIDQLQQRVDMFGDQRAQLELQGEMRKADLMMSLYEQNPMNPQRMIENAMKIKEQQIAQDMQVQKEVTENFKYMIDNFGSQWMDSMSEEELGHFASAMKMPTSVLAKMGRTMDEQKEQWEKLKYFDSQDFEMNKLMFTNELQIERDVMQFNQSLEKMGFGHQLDMSKLSEQQRFEWDKMMSGQAFDWSKLEAGFEFEAWKMNFADSKSNKDLMNKWNTLTGEQDVMYGDLAAGGNQNGVYMAVPVPHPSANTLVGAINVKLAQAYPNGHKFKPPTIDSLIGQCKWFSQELTTLENGKGWTIGSLAGETKKNLHKYVKEGHAFLPGQEEVKIGQTLITNDSPKFWHSATVNAITPEGDYVVTESNYVPLTATNTRIIKKDSPSIQGVMKTIPKKQYQVSPPAQKAVAGGVGAIIANVLPQLAPVQKGVTSAVGELDKRWGDTHTALTANQNYTNEVGQREFTQNQQTTQLNNQIQGNAILSQIASGTIKPTEQMSTEIMQVNPALLPAFQEATRRGQQATMEPGTGWRTSTDPKVVREREYASSVLGLRGKDFEDHMSTFEYSGVSTGQADRAIEAQLMNNTFNSIDRLTKLVDSKGTGRMANTWQAIGGDFEARNLVNDIKSNTVIEAIKRLKRSGGSMGAISEAELDLLAATVAELDPQKQGIPEFKQQLQKINDTYSQMYYVLGYDQFMPAGAAAMMTDFRWPDGVVTNIPISKARDLANQGLGEVQFAFQK